MGRGRNMHSAFLYSFIIYLYYKKIIEPSIKNYRIQKNQKQLSFLKFWVCVKSWSVSQMFAPTESNNVCKPTIQ